MTEYSIESLGDTLKKIVDAAKSLVAAAIVATLKFYDQHLSLAGRVGKGAAALLTASDKLKGEPKEKTVSFASSEYMFQTGTEVKAIDLLRQYKEASTGAKTLAKDIILGRKILEKADVKDLPAAKKAFKEVTDRLNSSMAEYFDTTRKVSDSQIKELGLGSEYEEVLISTVLPGNRASVLCTPKEGVAVFKMVTVKVTAAPAELPALAKASIKAYAKISEDIVTAHKDLISNARILAATGTGLMDALTTLYKTISKSEDAAGKETLKTFVAQSKAVVALIRQPYIELAKNMALTANAHLQYANASRKNLAAPKKEK